ncbi:class I SAM-dependent methyltransferase [Streptomyces sp. NRRL S-495]|uniref:class I SAM-dependent methyltransferase n=1 Tax=Streptomyces sp. NRRL S-495 TaxID=1609133 RepID=UPI0005F8D27C|nr:class I SAM-dependent methyltransferase [Streptomyces sp. NRRL S-495]KJY30402.1 hypothetical protein VR45_27655 [Streptomyces sp. NRRL S-495]
MRLEARTQDTQHTQERLREFRALEARREAAAYLDFFGPVTALFAEATAAALAPGPGATVLDLGCGDGTLGARLRERGLRCVATDLSPAMCAAAVATLGRGAVLAADATALPFRDGAADAAAGAFLLPHLPELDGGLRELRRVLRPGGELVLTTWSGPDRSPFTGLLGELLLDEAPAEVRAVMAERARRTEPGELRAGLLGAGFAGPRFERHRRTVALPSAEAWWDGMARASVGARHLLRTPGRAALREEFLRRAARFAGPAGQLEVPVEALVVVATAA